jgi:hypothetical protein
MKENKFWQYVFGLCLITGFISFGYTAFLFSGYFSLLLTSIFIGLTIIGLNITMQDVKRKTESEIHQLYEKIRNN